MIPISHFVLMISNAVTSSQRMQREGIKQFFAFGGMLIYINMLFGVTTLMQFFPSPLDYSEDARTGAVFIWLTVEWLAFISIIMSNCLFLAFRTCLHHKI